MTNDGDQTPRRSFASWMRGALVPRVWLHAAAAFIAGFAAARFLQGAVFIFLFTGPGALLFLLTVVVIVAVVFGALGRVFTRKGSGWWCSFAVLAWAPAVLVPTFMQGEVDASALNPAIIGGIAAAVVALLPYAGPPRVLAGIALVVTVVVVGVTAIGAIESGRATEAHKRLGTSIRPYVVTVEGYEAQYEMASAGLPTGGLRQTMRLESEKVTSADAAMPGDITLLNQSVDEPITSGATELEPATMCGLPLLGVNQGNAEDETSCVKDADGKTWVRTSAAGLELARILDGVIVRVSAGPKVSEATLRDALDSAKLMDDRYYRHLLYGEEGEYIPELDGLR